MTVTPHILFISIATNRYWDFIPPLHRSIRQYWSATDIAVRFLVLTNRSDITTIDPSVTVRQIRHHPWPGMTLYRYRAFLAHKELLTQAEWVVYVDADMLAVGDLGRHFLCTSFATLHPGYAIAPLGTQRPFERRSQSLACIREPEPVAYFYGGVQGGSAADFTAMCENLATAIDADATAGIMACWHDESHFNAYRQKFPPERVLSAAFAYPDRAEQISAWDLGHLSPVILALSKDHVLYRYGLFRQTLMRLRHFLSTLLIRWGLRRPRIQK